MPAACIVATSSGLELSVSIMRHIVFYDLPVCRAVRRPATRLCGKCPPYGLLRVRLYADAVGAEEKDIARRMWA